MVYVEGRKSSAWLMATNYHELSSEVFTYSEDLK